MVDVLLIFLGISLLLYCLLGGADYGAGILEVFIGKAGNKEQKQIISKALGPVWEANHIWLILVVVILFAGFPPIYSDLMTALHIPILILLLGIIARGCAFTFRAYDIDDEKAYTIYSRVFAVSSFISPIMLGIIAGALSLGRISLEAQASFYEQYLAPWLSFFPLSIGLFTASLFSFLAAVYLLGEIDDDEIRAQFRKKAVWANFFSLITGGLVFLSAELLNFSLLGFFLSDPLALVCLLLATALLYVVWNEVGKGRYHRARFWVAAQVAFILIGWFHLQYPYAFQTIQGGVSFHEAAAPPATLRQLILALVIGLCLVVPLFVYLLRVFKGSQGSNKNYSSRR